MKKFDLGQTFQILANVGVIIGLVFLTLEIRQNTSALLAESRQSVLSSTQTELFTLMSNTDVVASIIKEAPLSAEENIRLDLFLTAAMKAREYSWLQFKDGLIDESQWGAEVKNIQVIFDATRTRQWWRESGRLAFDARFAEFVDEVLASSSASNTVWQTTATWSAQ
jgi:hypothetical protein